MSHENRQLRMRENMGSGSSKDHLSKAALGVSPLEEKICAQMGRLFEDDLAWRPGLHVA